MKSKPILGLLIVFLGTKGVILIILKLLGIILWPWLWVTSPIWIDFILIIILAIWVYNVYNTEPLNEQI
jgi:hypothetical protein